MSSSPLQLESIARAAAASASGTLASFLAFVHNIHQDNRNGKKHMTMWIGDMSVPYFKLHAWSDQCNLVARRLKAGDICCFQDLSVREFRGNKEAHLTHNSFFAVLVRQNQFQKLADQIYVPFTQILPLVEWSKKLPTQGFADGHVESVRIKDLRENMLAHVTCRLRPVSRHDTVNYVDEDTGTGSITARNSILRQLVMVDGPEEGMLLNVWHDQFDLRTIPFGALVEVRFVVVTFNWLQHSLTANTTSESTLVPIPTSSPARSEAAVSLARSAPLLMFDTFAEATEGQVGGRLIVQGVVLERLELDMPSSTSWQSALLVEAYCSWCECTLPEQNADVAPRLYGPCLNQCTQAKAMRWRYRRAGLFVRDRSGQVVRLHVQDAAMQAIVGHIPAALVAEGKRIEPSSLDARDVVHMMLEAFVGPVPVDIQVFSHFVGDHRTTSSATTESHTPVYSFVSLHG